MGVKWVPWSNAVGMVKAAKICPYNGEAAALVEWGAAGAILARARLAIVNGQPQADYPISEQVWKLLEDRRGHIDRASGEIRCELPPRLYGVGGRRTKVVAQGVEFLSDRLGQLLPEVIELPVSSPPPLVAAPPESEPLPKVTRNELRHWIVTQIETGATQTQVAKDFKKAFPGKRLEWQREDVREIYRHEYVLLHGVSVRPGVRTA
jgi:hypothetical protein